MVSAGGAGHRDSGGSSSSHASGPARLAGRFDGPRVAEWVFTMKLVTLPCALALTALTACATNESSSSSSLTQEPGACGSLETHVIGIYQGNHGNATVRVDRPGKHALVLSAHEATRWTVSAAPGVEIEAIYAVGIHRQTVEGPRGIRIVSENKDAGDPYGCGFTYPAAAGAECDTQQLLNLVDKRVHPVTSYHGCYQGATWTIAKDLTVTGDCTPGGPAQTDFVQGCDGEDSCGGPIFL